MGYVLYVYIRGNAAGCCLVPWCVVWTAFRADVIPLVTITLYGFFFLPQGKFSQNTRRHLQCDVRACGA